MNFKKTKDYYYQRYLNINKIFCPYLEQEVIFNSNDFRHLIYSSGNKKRSINSIILRFHLVDSAIDLIKSTTTLQEFFQQKITINTKVHNKPVKLNKEITYWGFIGIIDLKWKIKVVIKKVGNGNPYFWSVIPNWITSYKRDEKFITFHVGDIEND